MQTDKKCSCNECKLIDRIRKEEPNWSQETKDLVHELYNRMACAEMDLVMSKRTPTEIGN